MITNSFSNPKNKLFHLTPINLENLSSYFYKYYNWSTETLNGFQ